MPITPHPSFTALESHTRLWRYMDFAKYTSMLLDGSLWVPNAETLAADDPWETFVPTENYTHAAWRSLGDVPSEIFDRRTALGVDPDVGGDDALAAIKQALDSLARGALAERANYFIHCWHEAPSESVAMWRVYGASQYGVAIKTTMERLTRALEDISFPLFFGKVQYLNPDHHVIDSKMNIFAPVIGKREAFSYEREARLVIWNKPPINKAVGIAVSPITMQVAACPEAVPLGVTLSCDLNVLIEEIVVSPFAPGWYATASEKLARKLGISAPVTVSNLLKAPF